MILSWVGGVPYVTVFTTQLQVAVVHCDIPRHLHIAPGALWVIIRVPALVAFQTNLRDEVLVLTELLYLREGPLQTPVAPQGDSQVAHVVQAVVL